MKNWKVIMSSLALVACGLSAGSLNAQEALSAVVATNGVTTNGSTGLACSHYGDTRNIETNTAAAGLTNLVRQVSNKTTNDLEIVAGTNNTVLTGPLAFLDGAPQAGTNQTLAWVFLGAGTNAASTNTAGTRGVTNYSHFATNNELTNFALTSLLQYATNFSVTNLTAFYASNLTAGPFGGSDSL